MRPTKRFFQNSLILSLLLVPLTVACTNSQGESEAPVTITTSITGTNPLVVHIDPPSILQLNAIQFTSVLKNPTQSDPKGFADVTLTRYVVTYQRVDGGTKVPAPETFGGFVLVPSGGSATFNNPPILYAYAMQQSPFDQLLPFNGGIDQETGRTEIDMVATIVFYGETTSGQRVQTTPTVSESLVFVQ